MSCEPCARRRAKIRTYLYNVSLGLSFLGNVLTGGDPEYACARAAQWLSEKDTRPRWQLAIAGFICWAMDLYDPGHCDNNRVPTDDELDAMFGHIVTEDMEPMLNSMVVDDFDHVADWLDTNQQTQPTNNP